MFFILSNLPMETNDEEIKCLIENFSWVASVKPLHQNGSRNYEYIIDFQEQNRYVVAHIAEQLNHYYWHSKVLQTHCPLFQ